MSPSKSVIPLKPINFEATAKAVEQFSEQNNIPSLTFPKAERKPGGGEGQEAMVAPPRKARVMKRLPMEVPESVIDSLKERAAKDKGASVRFVVLSALKAYGIAVEDSELIKDKRRDA